MNEQEIEDNYIQVVSDWQIVKKIIQRFEAEDSQARRDAHNQYMKEQEEEKERDRMRQRAYSNSMRSNYYYESPQARGERMRRHNDTVASMGYGSSYF
jgi:hypothetical protein